MEKRLDDSDAYIVSLQEKIKALVTEKETLLQAKKALEENKEQCQVMLCSHQKVLRKFAFFVLWDGRAANFGFFLYLFYVYFDNIFVLLCTFCVRFTSFIFMLNDLLGRLSLKQPILCQVGHFISTHICLSGVHNWVAQCVECWTCNQRSQGLIPVSLWLHSICGQVVHTLFLCHQAV